jgi:predicted O-linked N-acetylglucosamine transferase (SPINDLY family)
MTDAASATLQLALDHHRAGRLAEAEAIYRQLLAANPRNADALHLLGLIAQRVGRHGDAITLLQRSIAINPQRAAALAALGASLGVSGRLHEARDALTRAVQLDDNLADAHLNLGNTFEATGQPKQAISSYDRALRATPGEHTAHAAYGNRGRMLLALDRPHDAIADFAAAVRLRPGDAPNHFQLGLALEGTRQRDEAADSYRRAIELDPSLAEAHFNLGACVSAGGEAAEAIGHLTAALRLMPGDARAHQRLLHAHHYDVDFDPRQSRDRHVAWARKFADPLTAAAPPHANSLDPNRRLRIGYVSPDFRRHSVMYFLEPLLAAHDKSGFEIFCYAHDHKLGDDVTARLQGHADHWRSVAALPEHDLAQRIRADGIDILIDLAGHVQHNRLMTFARKPAPVLASYLGYPETTGLGAIDFRLTDALADPADNPPGDAEECDAGQLIRLPGCAWCYRPDEHAPPPDRADDDAPITFGCFNVARKINAALIGTWAAILRATPGSRMIIKDGQGTPSPAIPRLRREFDRLGIAADRVELLSYVPDVAAHFGLYRRIDVALDTFPYHGTTTTCEALWMGVPVVTRAGDAHLSRVGGSLLAAVGLSDLVTQTTDDYVATAVRLAGEGKRTSQQRHARRAQMRRSPLMDAETFARNVESAYRAMWRLRRHSLDIA